MTRHKQSILIVANPASGRGRGARTASALSHILRAEGMGVIVQETAQRGDAERMIREESCREASRPDCIVACGGDGTVQEVAGTLATLQAELGEACPLLGLAPAGRCNDFARALGIARDPAAIAEAILRGEPRAIDLGRVNDRYFCTVATLGVDAEVTRYVNDMKSPLRGTAAYIYGALRVLARHKSCHVRVTADFGTIEKSVFLASTANTASYGGAIRIAPGATPTDGLLDLCVIDGVSRLRSFFILAAVLAGRHQAYPDVHFFQTARLEIDADEPLEMWADGEPIGRTPVTIEAVPAAVRVLLPP